MEVVLRCEICNKPFDKESTLKRHGYYCRSRRVGKTPRARACLPCVKSKARCDSRKPECSRCKAKAVQCHYSTNKPKNVAAGTEQSDETPTSLQEEALPSLLDTPDLENWEEINSEGELIASNGPVTPNLDFANLGGDFLDWNDLDIDLTNLTVPDTNSKTTPYVIPEFPDWVNHSQATVNRVTQDASQMASPAISIPLIPSSTVRSLVQRAHMKIGAERTVSLMFHVLKSYPQMMLRNNILPPFIHPHLISLSMENDEMEPLHNCISLVHMISSGLKGSRKLFWRNVRLECERWRTERSRLNRWELLAAMQALVIYLLIRLDEGETEHNNFDFLLLSTVTAIAKQLNRTDIAYNVSTLDNYDSGARRREWIFQESSRRLCIIYQVVNMLVYFEPAAMCSLHETNLILAPLPARKELWEASNQTAWQIAHEREPMSRNAYGLTASGDLVQLDERQLYCNDVVLPENISESGTFSSSTASWDEWCSGMDGFGGLIMLAASLVV